MATHTLNALPIDALNSLLSHAGLLAPFEKGQIHCAVCWETISSENLVAIYMEKTELRFVCDNFRCVDAARGRTRSGSNPDDFLP